MKKQFKKISLLLILFLYSNSLFSNEIDDCNWSISINNLPCANIYKTPNSSLISEKGIRKTIINKKKINDLGARDVNDVLKTISGLSIYQSGPKGQSASLFTRGSESNHTLALLNGIAINDQSVTDGLHDYGQDFIQTFQQIEIYKGPNGVHFGPNAVAGAINFITDIDYQNNYTITAENFKNNSASINQTRLINDDFHLNIKGAINNYESLSAISSGNEKDGVENYQLNINSQKFINDNLKFKTNLLTRKTLADYDGSRTSENGFISNNKMNAFQASLENLRANQNNNIILHYHKYDRKYNNENVLDEYYSQAFVIKTEASKVQNNNFTYGFGSEFRNDWGNFENRGDYAASTNGRVKNFGLFTNTAYSFNDYNIFSFYLRSDNHDISGNNQTFKLNFLKKYKTFDLNLTQSTGLRNPTLYELFGTDNYGMRGNKNLNPEKSLTNEINFIKYFSDKIIFNSSFYKTKISDSIEPNSLYFQHENMNYDLNQKGIEQELIFKNTNNQISFQSSLSQSRKQNGKTQNRRPEILHGIQYLKKLDTNFFGQINFNLNFNYTGRYIDWDGEKNSKQKSTDILDFSLSKKLSGNIFSIHVMNFFNEIYEKPATYSQEGRQILFRYSKSY